MSLEWFLAAGPGATSSSTYFRRSPRVSRNNLDQPGLIKDANFSVFWVWLDRARSITCGNDSTRWWALAYKTTLFHPPAVTHIKEWLVNTHKKALQAKRKKMLIEYPCGYILPAHSQHFHLYTIGPTYSISPLPRLHRFGTLRVVTNFYRREWGHQVSHDYSFWPQNQPA